MSEPHWKSCDRDDWLTPSSPYDDVLDRVQRVNTISLDPCAPDLIEHCFAEVNIRHGRHCRGYYGDGLIVPWGEFIANSPSEGLVFSNPPYGGRKRLIDGWVEKYAKEAELGVEIIALVAASTGAQWFKVIWETAQAACWWEGRIKFLHPHTGKPVGSSTVWSVLPYWGSNVEGFLDAFAGAGELAVLNQPSERAIATGGLSIDQSIEPRGNGAPTITQEVQ